MKPSKASILSWVHGGRPEIQAEREGKSSEDGIPREQDRRADPKLEGREVCQKVKEEEESQEAAAAPNAKREAVEGIRNGRINKRYLSWKQTPYPHRKSGGAYIAVPPYSVDRKGKKALPARQNTQT